MSDQKQREKALDITQSYIVQAPAGSGKTELLMQRYLKLLLVCDQPENVMAMTFTNKAVNELSERVLSALKSTQNPPPVEAHKQTTYGLAKQVMKRSNQQDWQLLQNPKRLKISTIDGLSSLIVSRYPSDCQLVPYQVMAEKWERDKAYKHAAMQTLLLIDDKQHGKEIADLLLYLDNHVERFYRLIMQMLAKRDQWLTRLYRDNVLNAGILQHSARQIVEQHLQQLQQLAKPYLDTSFFALMSSSTEQTYAQVDVLPSIQATDLGKWQAVQSLCLTKDGSWRKSLNKNNGFHTQLKTQKNALIEIIQGLSECEPLQIALQQLTQLPDVDFSQAQVDMLTTIAEVLKLCVAQLNVYFEQQQAHDFIQVALNANQILDTQTHVRDIALCLDYQIQHLLVDEFQDTSTAQFNTIERLIDHWQLGDGKTLFLVGDPMQSIYRFRESQVGLFLRVKAAGIANIKPTALVLSTNFRSSQSIVAGNNQFFQHIFPTNEDIYQGAIPYAPSKAASAVINNQAIAFHPFTNGQQQAEAQSVLEIVQTALANSPKDEIAVLVRNRSHLAVIAPLLKQHNITFESLKTTLLKNHLLVRDLLSLTKALLHLGDKLAWLSVLRAPWCGLILNDLLLLAESETAIIYQQLADETVLSQLSEDGQSRARHLHRCLQDSINNQARFTFVELLTHAFNQLTMGQTLPSEDILAKTQFLQIINHCEQQQLLNIDSIEKALNELYAPSENAPVKLMTIHQSKGLEFDTVILPGLGRVPRHDDVPMIYMKTFANQALLLAPIKSATQAEQSNTYRYLKFVESKQNQFETMRLLYVAMTRAKKQLHLLGAVNGSGRAAKNSLLALLMPFYQNTFGQSPVSDVPVIENQPIAPPLQRFKNLQTPHNKFAGQTETVAYQQNAERLFKSAVGTLVHQYFEYGLLNPSRSNINARLIEIGTPPSTLEHWRNFVLKLLNNAKYDTQFNWLFKHRASTLTEVEFISDGRSIMIDRLFIDNDVLWIIDFKTAEPAQSESLAQFISRQQTQHAEQLLFYKSVLADIYPNNIQCALYCPAVCQLIEIQPFATTSISEY